MQMNRRLVTRCVINPLRAFLWVIVLSILFVNNFAQAQNLPQTIGIVQNISGDKSGLLNPGGIVYSSRANVYYVIETSNRSALKSNRTEIKRLSVLGQPAGSTQIEISIDNPINMAMDDNLGRLLFYQKSTSQLVEINESASGNLEANSISSHNAGAYRLQNPQGMSFDPVSNSLYILDAAGPRVIHINLLDGSSIESASFQSIFLSWANGSALQGMAYQPVTGNLFTIDLHEMNLIEFNTSGQLINKRDLSNFDLKKVQGIVFAPSGDQTDKSTLLSLYIADSGSPITEQDLYNLDTKLSSNNKAGEIVEFTFIAPPKLVNADYQSALVKTTNMALYSPPSPDPSGLTYVGSHNSLLMCDGEVEETVNGITHFMGANIWEINLDGSVIRSANISPVNPTFVPMTDEPTGSTWNPTNGHYYFTDDNAVKVFDLNPGSDGIIGTSDDSWTSFSISSVGSGDPEGIAYDTWSNHLFVVDGTNREIYEFTLTGDLVNQFDVQVYGISDPESVEFNFVSNTLFILGNYGNRIIVETTTSGTLLQTINISANSAVAEAGMAYAPASDGSGQMHFYIVDRGIDNNEDPNIIDGKMYEMTAPVPGSPANTPPQVNAGPNQSISIDVQALLTGSVVDDGNPDPPGVLTTQWSLISGPGLVSFADPSALVTSASFSHIGTYVLRLTASDSELISYSELTVTVIGIEETVIQEVRVAASSDDAEENSSGSVNLTSSDLELVEDSSNQTVGMRFNTITIPKFSQIIDAYIQFQVDEVSSGSTNLSVRGEAQDNPGTFTTSNRNISLRIKTSSSISWSPLPWTVEGQAGIDQRTPDLSPIIQEIVNRSGWMEGNSLVIIINGSGVRTAEAYDGTHSGAPLLHIEYAPYSNDTPTPTYATTPSQTPTSTASGIPTATPTMDFSSFSFISWGDAQNDGTHLPATSNQAASLNPAFTIFNGDLESEGFDQSQIEIEIEALNGGIGIDNGMFNKTFFVRGNHDDYTPGSADLWEEYFTVADRSLPPGVTNYVAMNTSSTFLTYSFDYGNSRFIGVDVPGSIYELSIEELNFIDQRLTEAEIIGLYHAFLFFHGPEYCVESIHCSCTEANDASCTPTSIIDVINRHPIVSATFHGHEHILGWVHMSNTRISGLSHDYEEFITSPSGQGTYNEYLFPERMDYVNLEDTQGFALINVSAETFTVNLYRVGTDSPVWSRTFSKTVLPTETPTHTLTTTASPTQTPLLTNTQTVTPTNAELPTSTTTPSSTIYPIYTASVTPSSTPYPTLTSSNTPQPTTTSTPTLSPTPLNHHTIDVIVRASSDDAEEEASGWVYLNSSDLELVEDTTIQTVGIRFQSIAIPKSSQIISAYIQFQVDEVSSGVTNLNLCGEAQDNPDTFTSTNFNISSRVKTSSSIDWSPLPWTVVGQTGIDQRTPDISPIIQEVVNRSGWVEGNSLVIIINGSGERTAGAYDGTRTGAPILHIEYVPYSNNTPTATYSTTPSQTPTGTRSYTTTPTNTVTHTPTHTSTPTTTPTASPTQTSLPTNTPTVTPMNTVLPTRTATVTLTSTTLPTQTSTATPTNTPQPTQTSTPTPTLTSTPTPTPDSTYTPTASSTTIPTNSQTPTPTSTIVPSLTFTATSSYTPLPTNTSTLTPTPTQSVINLLDVYVRSSSDDAEESASGSVSFTDDLLELVYNLSNQIVGIRFKGLPIPQGSIIIDAYIQFYTAAVDTNQTSLVIFGQADANPASFNRSKMSISTRPLTISWVEWKPVGWININEAGENQRTTDISPIIQELVNQPSWVSGNAMVFIISGAGKRTAYSYNGQPEMAPMLHIEYISP